MAQIKIHTCSFFSLPINSVMLIDIFICSFPISRPTHRSNLVVNQLYKYTCRYIYWSNRWCAVSMELLTSMCPENPREHHMHQLCTWKRWCQAFCIQWLGDPFVVMRFVKANDSRAFGIVLMQVRVIPCCQPLHQGNKMVSVSRPRWRRKFPPILSYLSA